MKFNLPRRFFRYWHKCPAVFRSRNPISIAGPSQIFSALLELASRLEERDSVVPMRFFKNGIMARDAFPYRALASDRTFQGYVRRIKRKTRGSEFCIVINQFQALNPHIFAHAGDFLSTIFQSTGIPCGGASLEFFCGNYRATPFGVHKDEQDVLTFVLGGTKRFLLWPFETLQVTLGAPKSSREHAYLPRSRFDINEFRNQALILEGKPGDLIYWPKEWWHVAESDGSTIATLSLGLFPTGNPLKQLSKASYDLWREGFGIKTPYKFSAATPNPELRFESYIQRTRKKLEAKKLENRMKENMLSFVTGSGFHEIPRTLESNRTQLARNCKLRLARPDALSWFRRDGTWICLGANGRLFDCPAHPKLLRLLKRFASGDLIPVQQALAHYCGRSKTKTVIHLLEEKDLMEILCRLVNCGALRIVD